MRCPRLNERGRPWPLPLPFRETWQGAPRDKKFWGNLGYSRTGPSARSPGPALTTLPYRRYGNMAEKDSKGKWGKTPPPGFVSVCLECGQEAAFRESLCPKCKKAQGRERPRRQTGKGKVIDIIEARKKRSAGEALEYMASLDFDDFKRETAFTFQKFNEELAAVEKICFFLVLLINDMRGIPSTLKEKRELAEMLHVMRTKRHSL